ncbi:uncharacterized protein [Bactrocera oleae]|uniref:uncharacterized protein n=1 Tax=Bactrocera oleae TaxID=104688 RepID=UPI00387EAB07
MSVELATRGYVYSANEIRIKIHNFYKLIYYNSRTSNVNVNIQNEFLEEFRAESRRIATEIEAIKEDGREALQIERERSAILEKFMEAFKQSI